MEATEIQNLWKKYDEKLERNWKLNLKLVKDMNLQKAKSSMRTFTLLKVLSIVFQMMIANFLISFIIDNFHDISLTIPAYVLAVLTYIALFWNFYQLGLIFTINYGKSIVFIQKKIEKLKILKLRYNKYLFYGSYPYVFLMTFTILHIDLKYLPIKWLIPNLVLVILWIPLCNWLIKKYNSRDLTSSFWKSLRNDSSLTPESASKTLNNSLRFLNEIQQFEQTK